MAKAVNRNKRRVFFKVGLPFKGEICTNLYTTIHKIHQFHRSSRSLTWYDIEELAPDPPEEVGDGGREYPRKRLLLERGEVVPAEREREKLSGEQRSSW